MTVRRAVLVLAIVGLLAGIIGARPAPAQDDPAPPDTSAPAPPVPDTTPDPSTSGPGATPAPPPTACDPAGLTACDPLPVPDLPVVTSLGGNAPATPGSGVDGLLRGPPQLPGDHEPTFYERYGLGAYSLDTETVGTSSSGLDAMAAALWAMTAWAMDAAIKSVQWAFSLDLFTGLGDTAERVVSGLRSAVFDSYLGVFLALASLWAVWQGVARRRVLAATEGIAWTVFALTVALVFLAKPGAVLGGVNDATTTVARAAYDGLAGVAPTPEVDDGIEDRASFGGDRADNELRRAGDQLWRTTAYVPWAVLHFGSVDVATDVAPGADLTYGERLLRTRTFTLDELTVLGDGDTTYDELRALKLAEFAALREDLSTHHPEAVAWLNGERDAERFGVASVALAGTALFALLLFVLAGAVIITQLALLLLVATAPVFLVVGVVPGRGRSLTLRWLELFLSLIIKRVVFGIVLAVVLILSGGLLATTIGAGWGLAIALQVGLVASVFVYRKALVELYAATAVPSLVVAQGARQAVGRAAPAPAPDRRPHRPEQRHRARPALRQTAATPPTGSGAARLRRRAAATPTAPAAPPEPGVDPDA